MKTCPAEALSLVLGGRANLKQLIGIRNAIFFRISGSKSGARELECFYHAFCFF
jgi:hypothetical protein